MRQVLYRPAIYTLELTAFCNNHCPGCSNVLVPRGRRRAHELPPLPAAQWIEWLEAFGPDAVRIRLSGGEPTTHPEFFEILAAAVSFSAWVTIFTNGRWRNPQAFVARARGYPKLAGLLISLHGARPAVHEAFSGVRGSFAQTVANIRLAIDAGLPVALNTVITRQNCTELEAVMALGRRLGVQHHAFNRYIGPPLPRIEPAPDDLRRALTQVQAWMDAGEPVRFGDETPQCFFLNGSAGCLAGSAAVAVDAWGGVHPCASSPTVAGSLLEHSLDEIWAGPQMQAWRDLTPGECRRCAAFGECHGACKALQEIRPGAGDPLMTGALSSFEPYQMEIELPADGRPLLTARWRNEDFGPVMLGEVGILPVYANDLPLLQACDGRLRLSEMAERFGPDGLDRIGDFWQAGMLRITI